jgi:hypothetical protein
MLNRTTEKTERLPDRKMIVAARHFSARNVPVNHTQIPRQGAKAQRIREKQM